MKKYPLGHHQLTANRSDLFLSVTEICRFISPRLESLPSFSDHSDSDSNSDGTDIYASLKETPIMATASAQVFFERYKQLNSLEQQKDGLIEVVFYSALRRLIFHQKKQKILPIDV